MSTDSFRHSIFHTTQQMEPRRNLLTRRLPRATPNRTIRRNVGTRHLITDIQYLKGVQINSQNITVLETSLKDAFGVRTFTEIRDQVRTAVETVRSVPAECSSRTEWVSCLNTCNSTLSKLIRTELASTAYMLRTISKSVLSVDSSVIEFDITAPLTGLWATDANNIRIQHLNRDTAPSRLILGLGPSASGKTYWAKSLIAMLSNSDGQFPKTFLSIDGGIYRQHSLIYTFIVEEVKRVCIAGFDNLMLSSWKLTQSSLFNTGGVKKAIVQFLKQQTIPISLYVPETLGDCGSGRLKYCSSKLSEFLKITNDTRWIAIMIWQHKHASECSYPPFYKCAGCTESGTKRETEEGKKYSNGSYEHSLQEGEKVLVDAPGGSYSIHNSGSKIRKSTITDYSLNSSSVLSSSKNMKTYNYVYRRTRRV